VVRIIPNHRVTLENRIPLFNLDLENNTAATVVPLASATATATAKIAIDPSSGKLSASGDAFSSTMTFGLQVGSLTVISTSASFEAYDCSQHTRNPREIPLRAAF